MKAARCALTLVAGYLAATSGYLVVLLAAGAVGGGSPPRAGAGRRLRFCVLVPAHDEEHGIGATVGSLLALDFPRDRFEVVVVADNCSDRTAEAAAAAGARVLRRDDPTGRGKGHALAWAIPEVLSCEPAPDAIVVVDADCSASANLLEAFDARMRTGAVAVQAGNGVSNADASPTAALRFAAAVLINEVRPRGKAALGLSCGLMGTGMAFRRELLERHPWTATGRIEDREYHLELVADGERVEFAPEAGVLSATPETLRAAREQALRWESDRFALARRWGPRLVAGGVRRGDARRLHAAAEPLVAPQAALALGNVVALAAAAALGARRATRLAAGGMLGQAVYVIGGLALAGAPPAVFAALLRAPVLVAWKASLYVTMARGRSPKSWMRGPRRDESTPGRVQA